MAMQTGFGLGRIVFIFGAGYTGTILLKNGKLSDLLGELQSVVKGLEHSGDQAEGDSEYSDVIAAQVYRLAQEVRKLASSRPITVVNGSSGQSGNLTSLVIPAATLGALGYGYMWWKGISFSDLMFVTQRNIANAVSNFTKHLENLSDSISNFKKHLIQRIQNLDDKMDKQTEVARLIRDDVRDFKNTLSLCGRGLSDLNASVSRLALSINSMEQKQANTTAGVLYLCQVVEGPRGRRYRELQEQLQVSGTSPSVITYTQFPTEKEKLQVYGGSCSSLSITGPPTLEEGKLSSIGQQQEGGKISSVVRNQGLHVVHAGGIGKLNMQSNNVLMRTASSIVDYKVTPKMY